MDVKNKPLSILENPANAPGGEVVLFSRNSFEKGLGVIVPFERSPGAVVRLHTSVEAPPAVALKPVDKKDPTVIPDLASQIEEISTGTHIEDAARLSAVRQELRDIQKGIK